jgi:hypothetical protein
MPNQCEMSANLLGSSSPALRSSVPIWSAHPADEREAGPAFSSTSDGGPKHANALLMLAEVLDARDQGDDAAAARSQAIATLRAKGTLLGLRA